MIPNSSGFSPPGSPKRGSPGKKKKESEEYTLYKDREIWSNQHSYWRDYEVKNPRLPSDADEGVDWADKFRPLSFRAFMGRDENVLARKTCVGIAEQIDLNGKMVPFFFIHGPAGSGKTSYARCFCQQVTTIIGASDPQERDEFFLRVDCADTEKWGKSLAELSTRVKAMAGGKPLKFSKVQFRLVLLDNFDSVTAPVQLSLKSLIDGTERKVRYVVVGTSPKTLVGSLQSKVLPSYTVALRQPSEITTAQVLLSIAKRNKVGNERAGIKEMLALNGRNLTNLVRFYCILFL
jgi:hypothetical protein